MQAIEEYGTFVVSDDVNGFRPFCYDVNALCKYIRKTGKSFQEMTDEEKDKFRTS